MACQQQACCSLRLERPGLFVECGQTPGSLLLTWAPPNSANWNRPITACTAGHWHIKHRSRDCFWGSHRVCLNTPFRCPNSVHCASRPAVMYLWTFYCALIKTIHDEPQQVVAALSLLPTTSLPSMGEPQYPLLWHRESATINTLNQPREGRKPKSRIVVRPSFLRDPPCPAAVGAKERVCGSPHHSPDSGLKDGPAHMGHGSQATYRVAS